MKVVIIGAGELGMQLKHFIESYTADIVLGWLDDTKKRDQVIAGTTVLGGLERIHTLAEPDIVFAVAIGYKHLAFKDKLIQELVAYGTNLYTFVHPSATVDVLAVLSMGTLIYPGVILDKSTHIGNGAVLNNGVIVSHDSVIGSSTFIAPGVVIAGNVRIGTACFIGVGSTIIDGVTIADNTILGASSLVIDDITTAGKYVGGPHLRKIN